jgi:hypothetical protein
MRQALMSIDHTTSGDVTVQPLSGGSVACGDAMNGESASLVPSGTKRVPWAVGALWISLPEYSTAELQEFLRHEHGADLREEVAKLFIDWTGLDLWFASEGDIIDLGVRRMKASGLACRVRDAWRARGHAERPGMKRYAKWQYNPNLIYK